MVLSGNLQFLTVGADIGGCAPGFDLFNGAPTLGTGFTLFIGHQEMFGTESIVFPVEILFIGQST